MAVIEYILDVVTNRFFVVEFFHLTREKSYFNIFQNNSICVGWFETCSDFSLKVKRPTDSNNLIREELKNNLIGFTLIYNVQHPPRYLLNDTFWGQKFWF